MHEFEIITGYLTGDTQIIGSLQSKTVPIGTDVEFVVTYVGIPPPAVAWLTDGQPIINSDRIFFETDENGRN